jgi:uncharacterized damage-inducible protein DinB
MFTSAALREIHGRGHRSLARLIEHCASFTDEEFHCRLDGFGWPTLHLQLYHTLQAEQFWVSVLRGRQEDVDLSGTYITAAALQEYRTQLEAETADYLCGLSDEELSTRRPFAIDDTSEEFVPALVVLRVFSHIYHHQGQVLAMCRLLGRPRPGDDGLDVDFPL